LDRIAADLGATERTLEVDVHLVSDREIRRLNRDHRGVDAVTDVLSFPLFEPKDLRRGLASGLLGDVVVSVETASRQAAEMRDRTGDEGYGLDVEVAFLATHGLLHLAGHDHAEPGTARKMEALERTMVAPLTRLDPHALDRTEHARPRRL